MKDIIILMFRLMVCIFEIWMLFGFYNNFLKNKPRKSRNNIFIILPKLKFLNLKIYNITTI